MKEFFVGPVKSQIEIIDEKRIGRVVLAINLQSSRDGRENDEMIKTLAANLALCESIARSMHGNSPSLDDNVVTVTRGVSTYFSWDPKEEALIVEWGEVGPDGEAKLHTYLNRAIDLPQRHKEGMVVRSGHMAKTKRGQVLVCLIDSICRDSPINMNSDEYKIVRVLKSHGSLVIGSDGYPTRAQN